MFQSLHHFPEGRCVIRRTCITEHYQGHTELILMSNEKCEYQLQKKESCRIDTPLETIAIIRRRRARI